MHASVLPKNKPPRNRNENIGNDDINNILEQHICYIGHSRTLQFYLDGWGICKLSLQGLRAEEMKIKLNTHAILFRIQTAKMCLTYTYSAMEQPCIQIHTCVCSLQVSVCHTKIISMGCLAVRYATAALDRSYKYAAC